MKLMIILLIGLCVVEYIRITNLETMVMSLVDDIEEINARLSSLIAENEVNKIRNKEE